MDIFNGSVVSAIVWLLLFYFGSALFFCGVIEDDQICPSGLYSYEGWLTTIYFASATMSTVGYGDVTISGQEDWKMLIGIVYMLIALVFGYTVFATAAEVALGDFDMGGFGVKSYLFRTFLEDYDGTSVPLYRQVRRVVTLRVVELVGYFLILNIFGAMIERLFVDPDRGEEKWSWMTTVYWSVQTTTTIGKLYFGNPPNKKKISRLVKSIGLSLFVWAGFTGKFFSNGSIYCTFCPKKLIRRWENNNINHTDTKHTKGMEI